MMVTPVGEAFRLPRKHIKYRREILRLRSRMTAEVASILTYFSVISYHMKKIRPKRIFFAYAIEKRIFLC